MKLYKKILLVLLIFSFTTTGVSIAQNGLAFIEQVENPGINHNEAVREFSLKYASSLFDILESIDLHQNTGNRAIVNQHGSSNIALLEQYGFDNTGIINILGDNNYAKTNQTGISLLSLINMEGDNNLMDFMQRGFNRGALFQFEGNNIQYNAFQDGDSFSLIPQNSSVPAFNISTTRHTLPVIIKNN